MPRSAQGQLTNNEARNSERQAGEQLELACNHNERRILMVRAWLAVVVLLGAMQVGCGDTEARTDVEPPGSVHASNICSASTQCSDGTGRSCSGAVQCSASSGDFVQCDGSYQYCPVCRWMTGVSDNSYEEACAAALQSGTEFCSSRGGVKSTSRLCRLDANTPPYRGQYNVCCNGTW
jgi:hypothetical protein